MACEYLYIHVARLSMLGCERVLLEGVGEFWCVCITVLVGMFSVNLRN